MKRRLKVTVIWKAGAEGWPYFSTEEAGEAVLQDRAEAEIDIEMTEGVLLGSRGAVHFSSGFNGVDAIARQLYFNLTSSFMSYVASGKSFNFFLLSFPHLQNGKIVPTL